MHLLEKYKKIIEEIKKSKFTDSIIIFGSVSSQKLKPLSDLDIAIIFTPNTPQNQKNLILGMGNQELDISDFFELSPAIKFEIITKGKTIKQSENYNSIKYKTRNEWIDFKPRLNKLYKSRGYPQLP